MSETSLESGSRLTNKSVAAALITLTRYLAGSDPDLAGYLRVSVAHAEASGLSSDDLAILRLMLASIRQD